jgi:hypothetical protein
MLLGCSPGTAREPALTATLLVKLSRIGKSWDIMGLCGRQENWAQSSQSAGSRQITAINGG